MIPAELTAGLEKIDQETTSLGIVVQGLRDLVSTSMTTEDVTAVQGKLGEVATRLQGIASGGVPIPPGPTPEPLRARKRA